MTRDHIDAQRPALSARPPVREGVSLTRHDLLDHLRRMAEASPVPLVVSRDGYGLRTDHAPGVPCSTMDTVPHVYAL